MFADAGGGIAQIGGALVAIIAINGESDTVARSIATIIDGARVAVIAGSSGPLFTGACKTGWMRETIGVIAVDKVVVIVIDAVITDLATTVDNRRVLADAGVGITDIRGAGVAIVANDGLSGTIAGTVAGVIDGAGVAIVAGRSGGDTETWIGHTGGIVDTVGIGAVDEVIGIVV